MPHILKCFIHLLAQYLENYHVLCTSSTFYLNYGDFIESLFKQPMEWVLNLDEVITL